MFQWWEMQVAGGSFFVFAESFVGDGTPYFAFGNGHFSSRPFSQMEKGKASHDWRRSKRI
jgi:hypothetical protein